MSALLLSLLLQAGPCSFSHPPSWPSFHYQQMNEEALEELKRMREDESESESDIPEGAIVLGWVGTSMRGHPLHAWVWAYEDKKVSSRILHAQALDRLYMQVEDWLETRKKELRASK